MQSEQLNEVFSALAKAQGEMEAAKKDSTNPFFKSKYADLESVVEASRPYLSKYGLCVTHRPVIIEGKQVLRTDLGHSSGQYLSCEIEIKPLKQDIQTLGSYLTYITRYCYKAIVGIVTKDDDGEACMDRSNSNGKHIANSVPSAECILTVEQGNKLRAMVGNDQAIADRITKKYGVASILSIKQKDFDDIIKGLQQLKQKEKQGNTNAQ
jgi:hypothetical protein